MTSRPVFTTERLRSASLRDLDPIEVYAPGASGLAYDAATGMWHYNVQTPKDSAGKCVEMTLNEGSKESRAVQVRQVTVPVC